MKTQGEIEAAFCAGVTRFEQEYKGRGHKDIRTHLLGDLLVVRLQGMLSAAEQHLVKSVPSAKGRDLLKQVRTQLIESAHPFLEAMIERHRGRGGEPAPRRQHRHRRGGHPLHPRQGAGGPQSQAKGAAAF